MSVFVIYVYDLASSWKLDYSNSKRCNPAYPSGQPPGGQIDLNFSIESATGGGDVGPMSSVLQTADIRVQEARARRPLG